MTQNQTKDELKNLIKAELVKNKDDIDRSILNSVKLLKDLLVIEDGTGKIRLLNPRIFKNSEKIKLLLMGKYLASLSGVTNDASVNLNIIASELDIPKTTLSGPLSDLVRQNIVKKPADNTYAINPSRIEEEVLKLVKNE